MPWVWVDMVECRVWLKLIQSRMVVYRKIMRVEALAADEDVVIRLWWGNS